MTSKGNPQDIQPQQYVTERSNNYSCDPPKSAPKRASRKLAPTAPQGKADKVHVAWSYAIAAIIRDVLYQPDGKPPEGWLISRDLRIARLIQEVNGRTDLPDAIRGLRILYPSGKLTLKLIAAQKSRQGVQLYNRAVAAYRQGQKRGPSQGLAALGIKFERPA
jgi:hypothetical protein